MFELEQINDLINKIDESSLTYFEYKNDRSTLILSKQENQQGKSASSANKEQLSAEISNDVVNPVKTLDRNDRQKKELVLSKTNEEKKSGSMVKSPIVGVVYLQPSPDEKTYVQVGDKVNKGDVLCIVETMKLMNEIQSPFSGIVTEIRVCNEDVVDFDQVLFEIKE